MASIRGTSGNDTLDAGTGGDRLIGGTGNDTYIVDGPGHTVMAGEHVECRAAVDSDRRQGHVEGCTVCDVPAVWVCFGC